MEENKQNGTIYISAQEEITEIIDRIKNAPQRTVTLVVPKEAALFQDITNLKILQKKAEQIGKDISISRAGEDGTLMKAASASKAPAISMDMNGMIKKPSSGAGGIKRISDMVQKKETVDLRKINLAKKIEEEEKAYETPEPLEYEHPRETEYAEEKIPIRESSYDYTKKEAESSATAPLPKQEEREELFWEDLAENKIAEREQREEKIEGLFEGHRRVVPPREENNTFENPYNTKKKKKKHSVLPTISARFFAFFILICVLTASLCLFFILPKAEIAIALKSEEVEGDFSFIANEKIFNINEESGEIPAAKTDITSEKKQTFATTSKKRVTEKATGEITILNECSTGAQVLVAGTRFLSKTDGKIFKIEETATVPGFTKPEADIVPGQKTVRAVAAEAGEAYNISVSNFTIPAYQEKGDWRYSCLYARSDKAMSGGMDKEVAYVSQADYDKAKETLTTILKQENKIKIEEQKDEQLIFLNDASDEGTVTEASSVKVGDIADSFEMSATIKKSVLSVTKTDLEALLKKKIAELSTFENAKAQDETLAYTLGDILKKDNAIRLNVSARENFAFELDKDKIREEIAGKNREELNTYFSKMDGIKSVSVNLWPFWVSNVPESHGKIEINFESVN